MAYVKASDAYRDLEEASSRHSEEWYAELARSLGHPGHVNLDEIRKAEADGWVPGIEAVAGLVTPGMLLKPLAHRWRASARDGSWWVDHTTGTGNTIDSIEVPSGGTIGPLSKKAAQAVAAELNAALTIGREQGRRYWRKDWPGTEG